jgi:hypothetical protein
MQVTLNVDPGVVGLELGEIFKSLTDDQKNQIAVQVLKDFLNQPFDIEIRAKEKEIIEKIRNKPRSSWDTSGPKTDEQCREDSDYKEWRRSYRDSRTSMIEDITLAAKTEQQKVIKEMVVNNPDIQKTIQEEVDKFTEAFPEMAKQALTGMFMSSLASILPMLSAHNGSIQNIFNRDSMNQGLLNNGMNRY